VSRAQVCFVCGNDFDDRDRWVLTRGRVLEEHCSEACLQENIHARRVARAAAQTRWLLRVWLLVLVAAGGSALWHRFRMPQPESISVPFDVPRVKERAKPWFGRPAFGPPWPPTDDDWLRGFERSNWIYPLPGPARRAPTASNGIPDRKLGPAAPGSKPAYCRDDGRCSVDVGGELWGEHVYAVQDGVVERVQRGADDSRAGEYVVLAHFGGYVFTKYFHLAAIPLGLAPGVHVRAGEIIGLLGDTGSDHPSRHLTFALSIRPSHELSEVYWDPTPLMARWPMRLPAHGTVAGFVPPKEEETAAAPRRRR
jgi:hypothetical protein